MFLLSGATGRVGGAAAQALLEQDEKVRVIMRDAATADGWSARGAEVAVGTLADETFLTEALWDATGFFTLLPADFASIDFYGDQRRMADAISAAVEKSGVPHVVLLSSHGAELGDGTGPVKCMHYLEKALRDTGTQLTAVRSGYHQDNIAGVLGVAQAQGMVPSFLALDTPIRMVATRDVGRLVAECLMAPAERNEVVDIQGPWYSMREVVAKLSETLGKPLEPVEIPQAGWVDAFAQAGMSREIAEAFAEMYSAAGRFTPVGDRMVEAATPIDEVIATLTAP
jgi:uncharacterized protein YbjT (DUF2867 family)